MNITDKAMDKHFKFKSFKELDESSDDDNLNKEDTMNKEKENEKVLPLDLSFYCLLDHRSPIRYFKMMKPDIYECFKNAIP
jgi:hypothetical protein